MTFQGLIENFDADHARRVSLHAEEEKKKIAAQLAVAEAEDAVKAAARNGDESAYHDAEARLSFKKAVLAQLETANVFWTHDEADAIARDAWNACRLEQAELSREAWQLMLKVEELQRKIAQMKRQHDRIQFTLKRYDKLLHHYGVIDKKAMPYSLMYDLAQRAGTTYSYASVLD